MSKTTLLFPGQASQYVGMGRDIYDSFADVRKLYEMASGELGEDIARLSFEGPAEELKRTRFTQPAILLHSLGVLIAMREAVLDFQFAAGHSLGEYVALAACGALSFEDAVRAVIKRATLMEDACIRNPGTMAAIMGLNSEIVHDICEQASSEGIVVPANFNSGVQIVVSGTVNGVEKAVSLAREAGAKRAVMLEVGGAFHSPLMEPAREGLGEFLNSLTIQQPSRPVIANVSARPVVDSQEIRKLLIEQVTAAVKWIQTMTYLKDQDVTHTIEIGPGKVLTGLAKREMRPEQMTCLETMADIDAFVSVTV